MLLTNTLPKGSGPTVWPWGPQIYKSAQMEDSWDPSPRNPPKWVVSSKRGGGGGKAEVITNGFTSQHIFPFWICCTNMPRR